MEYPSKQRPLMLFTIGVLSVMILLLVVAVALKIVPSQTIIVSDQIDGEETSIMDEITGEAESEMAPLYFSTMTHLEGGWTQATESQFFFDRQAKYLRQAYEYAEQYGAVLTIESEIPMAEAMIKWGDNLLQEALDRGQGVGTHCDISPSSKMSDLELIQEFTLRKSAVDALVDPSENLGCAGGGGLGDWYVGAVGAGFSYLDGIVGFHYLAIPVSQRPSGWDNRKILSEYYHYGAPVEDEKQYYPFFISQVGFEEDPDGDLLVSAGDIGAIQSIAELDGKEGWEGECDGECLFNREDVDVLVERIRTFAQNRDTSRVGKIQVYIATHYFDDSDMEYFFEAMETLQNEGVMEWASQKEVYESVRNWQGR